MVCLQDKVGMKKIVLSGTISFEWDDWNRLILTQEDSYKIDLISKLKEVMLNASTDEVQINYHLSDKPMTLQNAKEELIKRICGALEADYEANGYHYSSWTTGTDYDTVLKVGGHSLFSELLNEEGKFIIFEINYN